MVLREAADVGKTPLVLEEMPAPEPGPGDVRVRVRVCGVCRTDLHIIEGDLPPAKRPVVPGHEVVGTRRHRHPQSNGHIGPSVGRKQRPGTAVDEQTSSHGFGPVGVSHFSHEVAEALGDPSYSLEHLPTGWEELV